MVDLAGNSLSTALNIGPLNGNRGFAESVSSSDRNDYYRFSLASASNFSVSMTGLRNNADLRLLNSSGGTIASSTRSGRSNESIARQLGAGVYYIRVSQRSGSTSYDLGVSASPLPLTPSFDPGATFATAFGVDLASGPKLYRQAVGVTDPVDTYRFTSNNISNFGATVSGTTGRVRLSLYFDTNNNGAADASERLTSQESNFNLSPFSINQTLGAGTYFVEVSRLNSDTAYNINLSTTAVAGIQPMADPGSSLGTAFNVGALSGSRAYRQFVGVVDPVDTYRFTLDNISSFGATISGLTTARARLSLYFDANNNGVADASERLTSEESNFNLASFSINQTLGAGTYFVEVAVLPSGVAGTNTAYNINLSTTAVAGIQPMADPGSSLGTAFNVGALSGSRAYRQFVGVVDPVDTYRFTLDNISSFGATISGLTTARARLSLYFDANNNGVADASERLTSEESNFNLASFSINQTLGAGTYFVEVAVLPSGIAGTNTAYNINLGSTLVAGIQPTVDPGSTFDNAFNVGVLSGSRAYRQFVGVVDPIDTYGFTLDSTRNFGATISGLTTARARLSLYFDANNNGIADASERLTFDDSNFNLASFSINRTLLAGTYFVEVAVLPSGIAGTNTAYNLNLGA
jgi:hypothetical protein